MPSMCRRSTAWNVIRGDKSFARLSSTWCHTLKTKKKSPFQRKLPLLCLVLFQDVLSYSLYCFPLFFSFFFICFKKFSVLLFKSIADGVEHKRRKNKDFAETSWPVFPRWLLIKTHVFRIGWHEEMRWTGWEDSGEDTGNKKKNPLGPLTIKWI